jgi:triosephosphate isomerase
MRIPFIGGNWKMNLELASAVELAEEVVAACASDVQKVDVALMPPFPYLQAVGRVLGNHGLMLGAQNLWPEPSGAYTGEVSGAMLVDLGAACVVVGHSERRQLLGETDALIASKLRAALDISLIGVLCVGELGAHRDSGRTLDVVFSQLESALAEVEADDLRQMVVAYEPVWAIGTGRSATPSDAQEVHAAIRARIAKAYDRRLADGLRIIYGGSVSAANAAELLAQPDIDGGLVGGAALRAEEFAAIVAAAARRS